jgi:hypothetical protein
MYHWTEGLKLVNTFEETFGDLYDSGEGVWSQLDKTVCQNLCQAVVSLGSFSGNFTVICYSLSHIWIWSSMKTFVYMQEKRGFSHAQAYLLNGMDAQSFWLQRVWLGILTMKTRLLKSWRLVHDSRAGPLHFLLRSHSAICRLKFCFQTNNAKKGYCNTTVCTTMLLLSVSRISVLFIHLELKIRWIELVKIPKDLVKIPM